MADRNPQVTPEAVRERIAGTFPGDLGVEVVEVTPEGARGRMKVDQRHLHPGGYLHGGAWVALADTVAAWGTLRNLEPGEDFTTVELKLNVFAAAGPGDELEATAEPLHVGRRTQVWEVRVYKGERLAATFIATQMTLPGAAAG